MALMLTSPTNATRPRAPRSDPPVRVHHQVQAYLSGESLPAAVQGRERKRRRDTYSELLDGDSVVLPTTTPNFFKHPKRPAPPSNGICGVMSKRGMPCPQRAGSCPYHSYEELEEDTLDVEAALADIDQGLCGVVSQRGLQCPHRREVCPYHTDAQRAQARADLQHRGASGAKKGRPAGTAREAKP